MEIESTRSSRIAWKVAGVVMTVFFTALPLAGYLFQGHDPVIFIGLIPAAVGLLMIFGLGRSAWIKVGETSISYLPAVGSTKVFPRSDVKSIFRVPGARGLTRLEVRDQENQPIVSCEVSFARNDVEKLAQLLGAKLVWDLKRGKTASLDEFMSQLTPEEQAEVEKHKRP